MLDIKRVKQNQLYESINNFAIIKKKKLVVVYFGNIRGESTIYYSYFEAFIWNRCIVNLLSNDKIR